MSAAKIEALQTQLRKVRSDNYAGVRDDPSWAELCRRVQALLAHVEQGPCGPQLAELAAKMSTEESAALRMRSAAALLRWIMTYQAQARPKRSAPGPRPEGQRNVLTPSPQKRRRTPSPKIEAARAEDPRMRCVSTLKGVGPKTAEKLRDRGLGTLGDLVYLIPTAYLDRRQRKAPQHWVEGEHVVVSGRIQDFRQSFFKGRYIAKLTLLVDADPSGPPDTPDAPQDQDDAAQRRLELRWFHRAGGLGSRVETGTPLAAVGVLSRFRGQWSMVHPEVATDVDAIDGIGVHYPSVKAVPAKTVQKACLGAVEALLSDYPDPLPPEIRGSHLGQIEALHALHVPGEDLDVAQVEALNTGRSMAHRRLAFDECFYLQLSALQRRMRWQAYTPALTSLSEDEALDREAFLQAIPFEPTRAQWRCIAQIQRDLGEHAPMLRLLQGDVGSGKTLVAFAAAMMAVRAHAQVALMAPTEILAKQHAASLGPWCERAGLRVGLLTGSTRKAERESLLALLAAGQIDLLIGTHALLVQSVTFARLGLVIVDEQHRFGVEQRAALRDKGTCPHLLVMTATPIPRSLALAAYGEMEVSVIDEMPPGRTPTVTRLYTGPAALDAARQRLVRAVLDKGVLAFVVCPLVEKSEALEVSDVMQTKAALERWIDPELVACVHGRMRGPEKDEVMERFRSGQAKVLVATTVIEVGVDVPEARVMLVEHAERFGLAQLHQLRGRIGRGTGPSLCMIHTASGSDSPAARRLAVMEQSHDGFVVAEHDLEQRGPGEVFGVRQSGVPKLRFASFRKEGLELLQEARSAAARVLEEDPELTGYPALVRELELRQGGVGVCATQAG